MGERGLRILLPGISTQMSHRDKDSVSMHSDPSNLPHIVCHFSKWHYHVTSLRGLEFLLDLFFFFPPHMQSVTIATLQYFSNRQLLRHQHYLRSRHNHLVPGQQVPNLPHHLSPAPLQFSHQSGSDLLFFFF